MYKILKAEKLAEKIFLMDVEAPRVARSCQPGEFVIVKMDEKGERIPLTICDFDREKGTVTIVFQIVGASTMRMAELKAGDYFQDFVGPLGQPSEFVKEDLEEVKKRKYLFVAGGVGSAPVYPQVKWMHEHGIDVDVVVGAKNHDMLILEDEMKAVAACVLGGISLSGGVGSVIGSSVGAIIMASISRLLVFMGFGSTYDNAITGIMLIVIVVADALMQRRSAEMNRRQRLAARTAGTANEKGGAES